MWNATELGNLAEWVGAFAAAATALIVFLQIKDLRKTVQNQTYQAVYAEMLNLDRFFFENCEFREYFYDGKEPPPEKMAQARIVAELLCDLCDYVYLHKNTMTPGAFKEWQTYMDNLFATSPLLQDIFTKRKTWYDHGIFKAQNQPPK